jgi:hypothetical protein
MPITSKPHPVGRKPVCLFLNKHGTPTRNASLAANLQSALSKLKFGKRVKYRDRYFLGRPDTPELVIRRDAMVAREILLPGQRPPMPRRIKGKRRLPVDLELREFGRWLLLDGAPGALARRGPKPDPAAVWRTIVAMVVASQYLRKRGAFRRPSRREISQAWYAIAGEYVPQDIIGGRIPTGLYFVREFLREAATSRPNDAYIHLADLSGLFR